MQSKHSSITAHTYQQNKTPHPKSWTTSLQGYGLSLATFSIYHRCAEEFQMVCTANVSRDHFYGRYREYLELRENYYQLHGLQSRRVVSNSYYSENYARFAKSRNTFQSVPGLLIIKKYLPISLRFAKNQEIHSNQSQPISNVCLHGCPEWSLCHWGLCVCNSGQEDGDIAAPGWRKELWRTNGLTNNNT